MKAMILAAGEGTRLRPLTLTLPKPMVPLVHQPLLERTVALLQAQGVSAIAVNLYHRPEAIRAHFGARLTYSDEPILRGTAGGVKALESFFDTTFFVFYGDNLYCDLDLARLAAFHRERGALATIATFTASNPSACGLVVSDPTGAITRFQEKPPPADVFTNTANAGVYVLEPAVLELVPPGVTYDFGKDLFPQLLERLPGRLFATPLGGFLCDTGTPENYFRASAALLERGERGIAPGAQVDPSATLRGTIVLGEGTQVEPTASVEECIAWNHVQIGAGARVIGTVLADGVVIEPGAQVGPGCLLGEGARVRAGSILPPNSRLAPGEHND